MNDKKRSGLICEIFKSKKIGECSNGGISAHYDQVLVILPEGGPFEERDDMPTVILEEKHGRPRAVQLGETRWMMFGGCFIYTSDSRFPYHMPVKLFDRHEA